MIHGKASTKVELRFSSQKTSKRSVGRNRALSYFLDASNLMVLADLSICHCEPEHNRDASLLFAARLQIDRIASRKVDRQR